MKVTQTFHWPRSRVWPWRLSIAGIAIGASGIGLSLLLANEALAVVFFWIGFALVFVGVMWSALCPINDAKGTKSTNRPIRVGAAGFALLVLGNVVGMFSSADAIGDILYAVGMGITVLAVVWGIFSVSREE